MYICFNIFVFLATIINISSIIYFYLNLFIQASDSCLKVEHRTVKQRMAEYQIRNGKTWNTKFRTVQSRTSNLKHQNMEPDVWNLITKL